VGRYRLEGSKATDTCGGIIELAARNIAITPHELHADVVTRTYAATATSGTLTAEGTFEASTCRGGKLHERWALARTHVDDLEGVLVSEWPIPGDCARTCFVVFLVRALKEE
jgi:hypothetical protein